jgi:hypothetical protein
MSFWSRFRKIKGVADAVVDVSSFLINFIPVSTKKLSRYIRNVQKVSSDTDKVVEVVKPKPIFCPECEAECRPGAKFCGKCGELLY